MAIGGKIAGITVEIGGDTSGLGKALKDVNRDINSTNRDLKETNKLLKLDPTNTNLLAQKQKQLGKEIELTKNKLKALKQAEEEAKNALANGDIGEEEFQALQREIIKTEQSLEALEKSAQELKFEKITQAGEKLKDMGGKVENVGKAFLPVTAAVTGLGVASVKTAADFEQGMDNVQSISGATKDEIEKLTDKAKEMGAKTKFSASEAADAFSYMAMAGWKTGDMLDGIEGIMSLAAASGEDLAKTSDIVTDALTAFGLAAEDSGHFADILAAASNNANTNVSMLGESFKYVAPVAGAMGYSAEDVSIALGLMANSGIKASSAGTALRTILTNMAKPTDAMAIAMEDLGLSLENSDGSMKSFMEIMKDMRAGFSDAGISVEEYLAETAKLDQMLEDGVLTQKQYEKQMKHVTEQAWTNADALKAQEAATLAGKTGMAGLLAIVSASDEDFDKLTQSIYECDGAAQTMADIQMDNLNGQLTIIKSTLEGIAIQFGEMVMPYIRAFVEKIQELLTWFSNLDSSTKKIIATVALVVAAIGPLLIGIGKLLIFVGQIMTFWPKIVTAFGAVKGAMLALSGPVGIVIAIITALVAAGVLLYKNWDTIKEYASTIWEAIKEKISGVVEGIKSVIASIGEAFTGIGEFISGAFETICNVVQVGIMLVVEVIKAYVNLLLIPWKFIWENFGGVITEKFNEFKTLITTAMTAISNVIKSVWNKIKSTITPILNGIKTTVSNVWNGIKSTLSDILGKIVTAVSDKWESVKTKTAEKFEAVKTKVSDVVGKIKEKISDGFGAAKDKAVEAFDKLKDKIKDKLDAVKTKVDDIVGKIKNKFNITLPHPKIKLPHPKISGNFSLNPPSVPKFSIDWYRKAYDTPVMFKDPTILSTAAGMKGFGDGPGGELVIGKNTMLGWFGQAMDSMLSGKMEAICSALEHMMPYIEAGTKMYINRDVLVGETAPAMNKAMGKLAALGGRGL